MPRSSPALGVVRAGGLRRAAVAVIFGAAFASCGGRTGVLEATLRAGDYPAAAARAVCENLGSCCTNVGAFDAARCVAAIEPLFALELSLPEIASNTRIPARCVDQLAASARQCRLWSTCTELLQLRTPHSAAGDSCSDTCFPARGTLACGGDGTGTGSCFASDGLFCNGGVDRCVAAATVGQPCAPADFSCKGSWCHAGVCAAYLAQGADCTSEVAGCAEGFVCEAGSKFCNSAALLAHLTCTCDRLRAEGEACTDDRQCASTPCFEGLCQFKPLSASDLGMLCSG